MARGSRDWVGKVILVLAIAIPLAASTAVVVTHAQRWNVVANGDKVEATFTGCTTKIGYKTSSERCGVSYRYNGRIHVSTLQDGGSLPGMGRSVGERLDVWVDPSKPDEPIRGAILLPALLLVLFLGLPLFALVMIWRARRRHAAADPPASDPA